MAEELLGCHKGLCSLELRSFVSCSYWEMKIIHGIDIILLTVQHPK
jgi:hypothetical protein